MRPYYLMRPLYDLPEGSNPVERSRGAASVGCEPDAPPVPASPWRTPPLQVETPAASSWDGSVGIVDPKFGKQISQQEAVASTGGEVTQIVAAIDERILHLGEGERCILSTPAKLGR